MIVEKEYESGDWIIGSAGTWTKNGLSAAPIAMQIANQLGLKSLEKHITRQIDHELLGQYSLIIVMEINQKEAILSEFPSVEGRIFLLSELATGLQYDIPDPAHPVNSPQDVGREIKVLIARGKKRIVELAESLKAI